MFRKSKQDVIVPQRNHGAHAADIAESLLDKKLVTPFVSKSSFLLALRLHHQGYDPYDNVDFLNFDPIADRERYLEIYTRDVQFGQVDPETALLILMHHHRLLGSRVEEDPWEGYMALRDDMEGRIGNLVAELGYKNNFAELQNDLQLMRVFDRASFIWCRGDIANEEYDICRDSTRIYEGRGAKAVLYTDGKSLVISVNDGLRESTEFAVMAYEAKGYPDTLKEVSLKGELHY